MMEMAKAYGAMSEAFGGPQGLLQYMMIQNNTYEKLAVANGNAVRGMEPKITVWNTGMSPLHIWYRDFNLLTEFT